MWGVIVNLFKLIGCQLAKFSFTKWLNGFNALNGEKFGKILFYVAMFILCTWVMNKFFTPKNISNTTVSGNGHVVVQQCDQKSLDKLVAEARRAGKNDAAFKLFFIRMF